MLTQVETSMGACTVNCQGTLDLEELGIQEIASDVFTNLRILEEIWLGNNNLKEIKTDTFNASPKLRVHVTRMATLNDAD